jgi:hypothetical protein
MGAVPTLPECGAVATINLGLNGYDAILAQINAALEAGADEIAALELALGTALAALGQFGVSGVGGVPTPVVPPSSPPGGSSGVSRPTLTPIPIPTNLPDISWQDYSYTYSSNLLNLLLTQLQDEAQNGGEGVAPDIQAAMARLALNKREEDALEALDAIEEQEETLGWNLASGALLEKRAKVFKKLALTAQKDSDQILIDSWTLAQKNTVQGWKAGIAAEKARMNFIYQAAATAVERFRALLVWVKAVIDEALGVAKIISMWNRDLTEEYAASGIIDVAILEAAVIVYEASVRANIAISKLQLEQDQVTADCAIELLKIAERAAETIARATAQVAAAAIGANTTSATKRTEETTSTHASNRSVSSVSRRQLSTISTEYLTNE